MKTADTEVLYFNRTRRYTNLKPKLREEPAVLSALVSFLELGLNFNASLASLCGILHNIATSDVLLKVDVNKVAGGHQMVVVDALDEGLDLVALRLLLLRHPLGDGTRISLDARYNGVAIASVAGAFIVGLEDDSLLSRVLAAKDDDDLVGLHNLNHLQAGEWF